MLSNTVKIPTKPGTPSLEMDQVNVQDGDWVDMTCVPPPLSGVEVYDVRQVKHWHWYHDGVVVLTQKTQTANFRFSQGRQSDHTYTCAFEDESGTSDVRYDASL